MNGVFVEPWFFLAVLNPSDPQHERALRTSRMDRRPRVTTDWVLVEVGDALCQQGNRDVFVRFHDWIHEQAGFTVVPATRELLEERDTSLPLPSGQGLAFDGLHFLRCDGG